MLKPTRILQSGGGAWQYNMPVWPGVGKWFILFPKMEYSEFDRSPSPDNQNATIHIHKQ